MTHENIERIWNSLLHYLPERNKLDAAIDFVKSLEDIGVEEDEIKIIYKLIDFKDIVIKINRDMEPQVLATYLLELSSMFHKYYAKNRIISNSEELSKSRLVLIKSVSIVIKNGLTILGISAPKRM